MYRLKNKDHIRHEEPIRYVDCLSPKRRGMEITCPYDWRQNISKCKFAVPFNRCKYCGVKVEGEYCLDCQKIRDAFRAAKEAEDRLIAFKKVMEM